MGFFGGSWIPLVFGYLPGKETKDYETFFSLVLQLVSDTQGKEAKLMCKKLLCDFEKAIHKAAKNVFNIKNSLQVKVKGCFFHFSSALWKRVQKAGMVRQYADYKDVRKLVRSCVGLAHCPPSRIQEAYNYIDNKYNFDDPQIKKFKNEFLDYVNKYWIHNNDFPLSMWNCWKISCYLTNDGL